MEISVISAGNYTLTIDVFAVANFYDLYDNPIIVDFVNDAVVTDSNSVGAVAP